MDAKFLKLAFSLQYKWQQQVGLDTKRILSWRNKFRTKKLKIKKKTRENQANSLKMIKSPKAMKVNTLRTKI